MSDGPYLQWLRSAPCAVQPCGARSEAHHPTNGEAERHGKSLGGRRGLSQKADDTTAFALCAKHHRQFHDGTGFFEGMDQSARRAWQDDKSKRYREHYEHNFAKAPTSTEPKKPRPTVKQEAEAFGSTYELGPQVVHDVERLLKKALRGEIAP